MTASRSVGIFVRDRLRSYTVLNEILRSLVMPFHTGKAIVTVAVWSGTASLVHIFGIHGILSGAGAGLMFLGALFVTMVIWVANPK